MSIEAGAGHLIACAQGSGVLLNVCIEPRKLHLTLQANKTLQIGIISDLFV